MSTNSASSDVTAGLAPPTVTVADPGGNYDGLPYSATGASVIGSGGAIVISFGDPSLSYTYYQDGAILSAAPVNAGTYSVVAQFAGNADYAPAASAPVTFTISPAQVASVAGDAVNDFSIGAGNPNGPWSYLYNPDGSGPQLLTMPSSSADGDGYDVWWNGGAVPNRASVFHNTTGATADFGFTIVLPPDLLGIDPEAAPAVVVRWTAPELGAYDISGLFQGIDTQQQAHDVEIIENSSIQLLGPVAIAGYGQQVPFDATVTLQRGDTIDFVVETGGTYLNLGTGLSASITGTTAAATVTVSDPGGTYSGNPFPATHASVLGLGSDGVIASFGDPSLSYTYYQNGTALTGAPVDPGDYTVVAHFAGNANYAAADSQPVPFTIAAEGPTANAKQYSTLANQILTGNIITDDTGSGSDGDSDPSLISGLVVTAIDGDPSKVGQPIAVGTDGGILTIQADGSFTYDPTGSATFVALPAGSHALDSVQYTIADSDARTATARCP